MITNYIPLLLKGIGTTVAAWLCAASGSFLVGVSAGIMSSQRDTSIIIRILIKAYTFIAKGIPAYVHILIAYFVLPIVCGVSFSPFVAATGALIFCSSGYVTEIIKAGIQAVPEGQSDAAFVLGYTRMQTIRYIIMPQALRMVLPALLGEAEQLLKSTALLATIGVTELTRAGQNIISRELNPLPVYLLIATIYLCFSALLYGLVIFVQQRNRYDKRY